MQARKSFSAKSLVMKRAFVIWFTFKLTIMYLDDNIDKMSFAPKTIWFLTKLLCCYSRAKLTNCLLLSVFWNLEKYSSIAVLKLSPKFLWLEFCKRNNGALKWGLKNWNEGLVTFIPRKIEDRIRWSSCGKNVALLHRAKENDKQVA